MLGINFYDCEETKEALAYLQKSLELMSSLPEALQLRHLHTIQDLYNHVGIILSDRGGANEEQDAEKNKEALTYLTKSMQLYDRVKQNTQTLPQKSTISNFDKYLLKKSHQDVAFSFYINQGLDLKKLEQKYTTTLFVAA